MHRSLTCALVLTGTLAMLSGLGAADQDPPNKDAPKKVPPAVTELLKSTPEDFIRRFDKNKDGFLSKDELPPFLAAIFERADANGDGKLDRNELAALQGLLRRRFAQPAARPASALDPMVERQVDNFLARMDSNKDGKISRAEAKNRLAASFDVLDTNKDGFLDRNELRRAVERFRAAAGGPMGANRPAVQDADGPDFDALDLNADGRLTREELKGTRFAATFDEIDTNRDGKIDPKEFKAYLRKKAAEKEAADKKKEPEKKQP
ncbi:MAG TPA: EF-hand domain-containing protein [Gemmataceae bacterium]|nr:EF-hand domain-containing protein [Gemmataceae bacterium]